MQRKVEEIIGKTKIPFIEGGCGFYLHYALTSGEETIDYDLLQRAGVKAKDIIHNECHKDWEKGYEFISFIAKKFS